MRLQSLVLVAFLAACATAGSTSDAVPDYVSWSGDQLAAYLTEHNIPVPTGYTSDDLLQLVKANYAATGEWTQDQVENAQSVFADAKEGGFDSWTDSSLHQWLVENGIDLPQAADPALLRALAQNRYDALSSAVSSYSSIASTAVVGGATQAAESLSSAASAGAGSASSVGSAASGAASEAVDAAANSASSARSAASGAASDAASVASNSASSLYSTVSSVVGSAAGAGADSASSVSSTVSSAASDAASAASGSVSSVSTTVSSVASSASAHLEL